MPDIISPFARPLYVMAKPVGASCNLRCDYCYYLEKKHLYTPNGGRTMSDTLLEHFVREYIQAQTTAEVIFTWHGGEPLMRPLTFYKRALELQRRYAGGRRITNVIQTNGTLLNDEWCRFLHDNQWLVGISIDGPKEFHDEYRRTVQGRPSWGQVVRGIALLQKHGVEWNAMAVVNDFNADYPLEFYHFFKQLGCQYLQLSPIVERIVRHADGRHLASPNDAEDSPLADFSVTPEQWGRFLCTIFDEWVRQDVGRIYVETFDCILANWAGLQPGICIYGRHCGHAGVMEYNGDVYSCDHYVFPDYRLGNVREQTLVEMLYGEQQQRFSRLKHDALPRQCRECRYEFACHGECPKNRFLRDKYGQRGLNYLCAGYQQFFQHVAPYMDYMKHELDCQRPPANVMEAIARGEIQTAPSPKDDPCDTSPAGIK